MYVSADLCNSLCTGERTRPMRLSDLSTVIWSIRGRVGIQTGQCDSKVSGLITESWWSQVRDVPARLQSGLGPQSPK